MTLKLTLYLLLACIVILSPEKPIQGNPKRIDGIDGGKTLRMYSGNCRQQDPWSKSANPGTLPRLKDFEPIAVK